MLITSLKVLRFSVDFLRHTYHALDFIISYWTALLVTARKIGKISLPVALVAYIGNKNHV